MQLLGSVKRQLFPDAGGGDAAAGEGFDDGAPPTSSSGAGGAAAAVGSFEEERALARRRHRKRVARIVVDQWLWVSRYRLKLVAARRHHDRKLRLAALLGLQQAVAAAQRREHVAMVQDSKRRYLQLAECLHQWSMTAKRQILLRQIARSVTLGRLRRMTRECWAAWRAHVQRCAQKRKALLQAHYFYSFITLTRSIRQWRAYAAYRVRKHQQLLLALQHAHMTALVRRFAQWRRFVSHRHAKRRLYAAAQGAYETHLAARGLRGLREGVQQAAARRQAAADLLQHVDTQRLLEVVRKAIVWWCKHAMHELDIRLRLKDATYLLAQLRLQQAFAAWRRHAADVRRLERAEAAMAAAGRTWLLQLRFGRWLRTVQLLQGQRVAEMRQTVLARVALHMLKRYAAHRQRKAELISRADAAAAQLVKSKAVAAWQAAAQELRREAMEWRVAVEFHRVRLQKRALLSWSAEARRLAIKAANKAAADEHARLGRLRRALDTWREHVDHCAAQRLAADFHRRTTLRAVVVLWLQHAQHESEQQAKWFRAVRHRYFVLVAAGLRGLQEAVDRRSAKLQLYGRMAAHYHCHLLRTAMTAWSRDFCPAMAARRLAMARAALKWRTSLLRKAIRAWRHGAVISKVDKARRRAADDMARRQLARRWLLALVDATACAQERRMAKVARLEQLRQALARSALRRVWRSWCDVHSDVVMEKFQVAQARLAWQRRMLSGSMSAWSAFVARRRVEKHHQSLAERYLRRRRAEAALQALSLHVQRRRYKREQAAAAAAHRSSALLCKGLRALHWYLQYRRQKQADRRKATEMYQRRLLREGAAQWLKVGLWRRQQLLQQATLQAAQALAEQTWRAEPYARRWLHLTRQRRRQRYAAAHITFTSSPRNSPAAVAAGASSAAAAAPAAGPGPSSLQPSQQPQVQALPGALHSAAAVARPADAASSYLRRRSSPGQLGLASLLSPGGHHQQQTRVPKDPLLDVLDWRRMRPAPRPMTAALSAAGPLASAPAAQQLPSGSTAAAAAGAVPTAAATLSASAAAVQSSYAPASLPGPPSFSVPLQLPARPASAAPAVVSTRVARPAPRRAPYLSPGAAAPTTFSSALGTAAAEAALPGPVPLHGAPATTASSVPPSMAPQLPAVAPWSHAFSRPVTAGEVHMRVQQLGGSSYQSRSEVLQLHHHHHSQHADAWLPPPSTSSSLPSAAQQQHQPPQQQPQHSGQLMPPGARFFDPHSTAAAPLPTQVPAAVSASTSACSTPQQHRHVSPAAAAQYGGPAPELYEFGGMTPLAVAAAALPSIRPRTAPMSPPLYAAAVAPQAIKPPPASPMPRAVPPPSLHSSSFYVPAVCHSQQGMQRPALVSGQGHAQQGAWQPTPDGTSALMQQGFAVAPYQETAHAHALVQAQQQQHQYQQRVPQPGQLAQPHQQQCTPVKRPSTAGMVLEVRSLELQLLQYKALKDETAACAAQARATLQALQAQGIQPGAPLHPQSAAAASVAALEQLQARQRMLTDELAAQRPHMAAAAQRIQQLKAEGRVLAQLAATAGALLAAAGGGNGGGSAFVS